MGSVPHLYTTGDNDPEIEPVSYFRHYMYCDACGAFELEPWTEAKAPSGAARMRTWPGSLGLASLAVTVAAGWTALVSYPPLSLLLAVAAALTMARSVQRLVGPQRREALGNLWSAAKLVVPILLLVALVEIAAGVVSPWPLLVIGLIGVPVALGLEQALGPSSTPKGLRCRPCGATYAHGTRFFTDLDSNPRGLPLSDVPRPLGRSLFLVGKSAAAP